MNAGRGLTVDQLFEVAGAMIPFLTRDELRPVWDKLGKSPCAARLGEPQRIWVDLFAAIGERDAERMARLAEPLLRQDGARKDFLLGAAITGRLALGERDQALALWREFADGMVSAPSNMLPELLRGHLFVSALPARPS